MTELKHILLVEDDERDLELALAALEGARLANPISVARDGVEALDYLFRREKYADRCSGLPAVVLLDLKLPKRNGIEVLTEIRQDKTLHSLPVVMLTSSREEPDIVRCYEIGANAYVVKPVDFQEFMRAVGTVGAFWGIINEPPVETKAQ
ncbi:response regulator [Leptonema illini]|jgi:CheY-like chemotaxis protein|uniref:Response regulator receiver protein n=1 Tax=Leptonema illini DSM 21528 TaxID=929563 RepID=H2C9Z3_9LEPT|nr:response regulator [Leptonema illini]EHQ05117.1 response regulator receiver protein [Leptonema illini DSM 21528]